MNILLVTGPDISLKEPYCSGIEAFIVTLANQMVEDGHTVDVIAKEADASVLFTVIDLGSRMFSRRSFKQQLRRFEKLHKSNYDVIHYNLFIPKLYEIAAKIEKPSLLTLHSPADFKRVHTYRKLADTSSITFVAISERIKAQWDRALYKNMPLIHNGIDVSQWRSAKRIPGEYLLWSARINPEKNVVAAIELAESVGLPLKIAGRITDQDYFDTYVQPRLNNRIEYVGHVTQDELKHLANGAKAYLATALWQEPFGLNTLEMLACGVPVIGYESAIPPDLRDSRVSIAVASQDWQSLIEPLSMVALASADDCQAYAQTMNVAQMSLEYTTLYENVVISQNEQAANAPTPYILTNELETA